MAEEKHDPKMDEIIGLYIDLRDQKEQLEAKLKEDLVPIKEKMDLIENAMLKYMLEHNMKGVPTTRGTAFMKTNQYTRVTDWEQVKEFIREKQAWGLLNRAVNKTVVLGEFNGEVPGVAVTTENVVQIRRS